MCVYSDSDTFKIRLLSSPLFSKIEIIAIATVLFSCRGPLKTVLLKKDSGILRYFVLKTMEAAKMLLSLLTPPQGQVWDSKLNSTPSKPWKQIKSIKRKGHFSKKAQ